MIGLFERLFGVQRLDPAIEECKQAIEEIEDVSDLSLACELYSLNQNKKDGEYIKETLLKYNLCPYEINGMIFDVKDNQLLFNEFDLLDDLPEVLKPQAS